MMRRGIALLVALSLPACSGSAADHERLGDTAYTEGRFAEALNEYETATRSGQQDHVWLKVGAAAMEAGRFTVAAEAYRRFATAEPDRVVEAAIGLERVARQAVRARPVDAEGLRTAVLSLVEIAPERPVGFLALATVRSSVLGPREVIAVLPSALGSAGSTRLVDSLLIAYGDAFRATTDCERATAAYLVVLRRTGHRTLRQEARTGVGICGLRLGFDALDGARPDVAESWFRDVLRVDSLSAEGLRAGVGVGDARLGQGDVLGAVLAYQRAWTLAIKAGDPGDSIVTMVQERLNTLRGDDPPPGEETPS